MTSVMALRGCFALLIAWLCAVSLGWLREPALSDSVVVGVQAQGPDVGTEAQREAGKALYLKNCAQCHGEKGDGAGYATPHLSPTPRDFTSAKFKVRTTPNGTLPTHQDLVNIIRRGMPYTSMPAWPYLISLISLPPFPPTSPTPSLFPSPWSFLARRAPRMSQSSSERSFTWKPAV